MSDKVLAEGVKALKESRFTYTPQAAVAEAHAARDVGRPQALRHIRGRRSPRSAGRRCGYQYFAVTRPAQLAEEQARVEITETLPQSDPAGACRHHPAVDRRQRQAARRPAAGRRRARDPRQGSRGNVQGRGRAEAARATRWRREYTLTIVSRPGRDDRRVAPAAARQRRNATTTSSSKRSRPDGRKLRLPIRNEETGETSIVDKFGVRVPQATFDAVAADKRDDGIVQRNRYGVKRRGTLTVDYLMPFDGGMITKW